MQEDSLLENSVSCKGRKHMWQRLQKLSPFDTGELYLAP